MTEQNKQLINALQEKRLSPSLSCDRYGESFAFHSDLIDLDDSVEKSITGDGNSPDDAVNDYVLRLVGAHNLAFYDRGSNRYVSFLMVAML